MQPQRERDQVFDAELLRLITGGDEVSFAALYDRHKQILFGLLLRILKDGAEAEEVLQETFLQVWQKASHYDEARGSVFAWLVTLTRSRAIDRLRATASRRRAAIEAANESPGDFLDVADTSQLAEAQYAEQCAIVRRALAEIPAEQRRVLLLAYFDGLTQSEISRQLDEPLGTVKTRMRAGAMKLREILHRKFNFTN